MKINLSKIASLFLIICTVQITTANPIQNNLVDIAREQRVLSQKIAKSYLLQAYGANFFEIRSEIKTSTILFENNLRLLENECPNAFSPTAHKLLEEEKSTWLELKKITANTPNIRNLNRVVVLANKLLKKSHIVYSAFRAETKLGENYDRKDPKVLDLLEISEKQEITSERLCLYFVAQKINVVAPQQNPKILNTLKVIMEKLDEQLIVLLRENVNNPTTIKIINDALIVFDDIRTNKTDFLDGKPSMNTIYQTTNKLNKLFRILKSEYQEMASI